LNKVPKVFKWVGIFLAVLFLPAFATYGIDRKNKQNISEKGNS